MIPVSPLPLASPPTARWEGRRVRGRELPGHQPGNPLRTQTSCSCATALRTAGNIGTLQCAPQAGWCAPPGWPVCPPRLACAPRLGRRAPHRAASCQPGRTGQGVRGWPQLCGNNVCYASSQCPGKRRHNPAQVTERAAQAPRTGEVSSPGRSEGRPETFSSSLVGFLAAPKHPRSQRLSCAPWPPSASRVQAPSLNSFPLPHMPPQPPPTPPPTTLTVGPLAES